MSEVTIIGIDLAKRVFQLHGARNDGSIVFRKKLLQGQMLAFFAQQLKSVVTMEACATAREVLQRVLQAMPIVFCHLVNGYMSDQIGR